MDGKGDRAQFGNCGAGPCRVRSDVAEFIETVEMIAAGAGAAA
jgi:hypothetical protein